MLFERISIERPGAYARGWIADRDGIYEDSRRGYGGQARTVDRLLNEGLPALADVERLGWITTLKATRRGAGALALQTIIERFVNEDVDAIGLIALPDDDAFLRIRCSARTHASSLTSATGQTDPRGMVPHRPV